jgi:ribosomal protein S18 acetylase RimI-like enzyme
MGLPAGYEFRAPTPDDLEAVADVLIADQHEDAAEPVLDADFIRMQWSRTDFDLDVDAWVVVDGAATIVSYGQVRQEEPDIVESWGVVHPGHRGRGIGPSLLDRIEARAADLLAGVPSPRFRHAIDSGDRAAEAMLGVRGLRPVRHFWHMQFDVMGPIEPGPAPEGIEIGGIEPSADLPVIHAILEEAFVDDWGDHPEPFDRWVEDLAASPSHDPTLWLMARDEATPVGVLTASAGDEGVWVDWLAVLASHRGRGIGAALLRRSFASFAARGFRRVRLNVDAENPTGATGLYERVGMQVVNRWDLWERANAERV